MLPPSLPRSHLSIIPLTFANPKRQIYRRKHVFEYLTLLSSYYCRISFNPKIDYFRSNKDYGLVYNEKMLYFLHWQEAFPNIDF